MESFRREAAYGMFSQQPFDAHVHALTVITEPHRLTHDGMVYQASHKFTGVANGASVDVLIKVPASTYPHLHNIRVAYGRGNVDLVVYEGATASADGTAMDTPNANRNSSNTPDTAVFHTPTVTDPGDEIRHHWVPPTAGGVGRAGGVADAAAGRELLLKPGTNYLLRITNNSGAAITAWLEIMFYEVGYSENVRKAVS